MHNFSKRNSFMHFLINNNNSSKLNPFSTDFVLDQVKQITKFVSPFPLSSSCFYSQDDIASSSRMLCHSPAKNQKEAENNNRKPASVQTVTRVYRHVVKLCQPCFHSIPPKFKWCLKRPTTYLLTYLLSYLLTYLSSPGPWRLLRTERPI